MWSVNQDRLQINPSNKIIENRNPVIVATVAETNICYLPTNVWCRKICSGTESYCTYYFPLAIFKKVKEILDTGMLYFLYFLPDRKKTQLLSNQAYSPQMLKYLTNKVEFQCILEVIAAYLITVYFILVSLLAATEKSVTIKTKSYTCLNPLKSHNINLEDLWWG